MRFASAALVSMVPLTVASVVALFLSPLVAPEEGHTQVTGPSSEAASGSALEDLLIVRIELPGAEQAADSMRRDILEALREAGARPSLPEGYPLEVVITPQSAQAGAYSVTYYRDGAEVRSWACACSGDEMRFRLGHETVSTWRTLNDLPGPEVLPIDSEDLPAKDLAAPEVSKRRDGERLWFAGVLVTAAGGFAAVLTGGVALTAVGISQRKVDRFGVVVAAAGGTAVLVGAPMWAVGARRRRLAGVSVAPPTTGRGAVLGVSGRF